MLSSQSFTYKKKLTVKVGKEDYGSIFIHSYDA